MKKRSFADGGMPNSPMSRAGVRTYGGNPFAQQRQLQDANKTALYALEQAGQSIPLAQRANYEAFMSAEKERLAQLMGGGQGALGKYTPGVYNPTQTYTPFDSRAADTLAKTNKELFDEQIKQPLFEQYGLGKVIGGMTPEQRNVMNFIKAEQLRARSMLAPGRGTGAIATYKPGTYDPSKVYGKPTGMKKGGAVKVKKMADGGITGQQRRAAEDPEFARRLANNAAYSQVQAGRRQFPIGSPEAQNYRAYQAIEEAKFRSLGSRGAPTGTYTAGTYNPNTSYTTQLAQQRAAADAAKKAADAARGAGRGMAKGGMTSSASKRGDGIAQRGKTKCKMR